MVVKKFQVQFIATNDKIIDVLISPLNFTYFAFFSDRSWLCAPTHNQLVEAYQNLVLMRGPRGSLTI